MSTERHAGPVTARLSSERQSAGYGAYRYRRLNLVVTIAGRTLISRSLCSPERCGPGSHHALELRNVWGGRLDEVLVEIYTGGAHCCFESILVLVDGAHAGRVVVHNWGDPGFRGEVHDGVFAFVSADDRFAYAFTSFAGSALPLQVWAIDASGRLADVTSTRLDLVRDDARRVWQAYVGQRGRTAADVRGVVAAWCADEYRLGQGPACRAELARAEPAGYLDGPGSWPAGAAFVKALKNSLARWGYSSA